ncbi:fatty acid synthase [Parasteatoda tepidariorum]|uniref:fatty acid synthase n=1 Tax=Parasteatoda tepidariorum TaxID=114398 RepID=UPI001C725E8D|nr:fatty acid synthase [Parasteatoda tepidariorum]XP_042904942.1 fatty acid synthase [Parasteatoda tepidariorum]XP_042904943.1 fatty acid synthase [Parasteatoda tepidariorum]
MMDSEVVITGISGRFPESDSIAEFSDNLFNKVDLLTEDNRRWEPGLYGLPRRMGMLKDITKFDNQFFGVHHKQAHQLDPQIRVLLELTHESIVDSGYDPEELRGKNIGVFIGNCSSESDEYFTRDPKKINGYAMTGCCRAMFANRISYTFDFKGPSFLMDTACSSGALALYEAVRAMQNNECEAAIVGGANLCLRPGTALQFYKLNMLSDDGMCKSFDAAGNGYGRSEAIVTLFLQKSNMARRKYASIVHIKTNTDGFKDQGITYPSAAVQKRLIQEVYEECKLDPLSISYVEAHGTGTPVGDPIEMSAISEIFCSGRGEPLLVGSVKSNMGHSEPTSGLCSIVKVLIAMEKGLIPPNLHFYNPNPNIKALVDGEVKIVTEPTPWSGGYAALSCFGFGGVNVHAVLKSNTHLSDKIEERTIPQLVLYSGRTEESVQYLFDELDKSAAPAEFYALLHKSVFTSTAKPYRGYKLIVEDQVISDIKQIPNEKRPVWYIFSGMGTQWPCMAKQLMNLEVFAHSIRKSAEVLKPYGLDLIDLVTNGVKNPSNTRSIIPAFVSIAAVQVALVDVLKVLGIEPDGFIGHSVGELGCAYADGCFNAEQMVLAAFWRGKAVEESHLEQGAMAALGVTWEEAKESCPKGVYPSCHNAEDSVTISGPKSSVKEFVEKLKADNVFAREVDSCGYAFHSQYIYPAAGKLQEALNKVIPNPKPRSSRWVSSSYPENEWSDASAKLAGASYFVHNLVSPVLFHEALHYVPKNALVIEIAPHHLLQAILKRVIGPDAEYIGLMKRNTDNTHHLLSSIGRLYSSGLNPQIDRLYPAVQMPVPKSTPMISPLIKWDHSDSWLVANWDDLADQSQMIVEVNVAAEESPDHSLLNHCIDGRCLYPATGYLVLAWRALAELKGKEMTSLPINFEEVKIHRATVLTKNGSTKFLIDITSAGGDFEISEGGMTVCTGRVYSPEEPLSVDYLKRWKKAPLQLKHGDIYKELKLRGYDYGPTFQGVAQSDLEGNHGLLKWTGDWIVFLDTMLQFTILGSPKRALYLPTRIQSIKINPIAHNSILEKTLVDLEGVPVLHEKNTRCCMAGGVELKNLKATFAPKHQGKQIPILEEYRFVPYDETQTLSESSKTTLEHYIRICSTVAKSILEKSDKTKHQISDLINGFKEIDGSVVSKYLETLGDNEILLKTLSDIMSEEATHRDFSQRVKNRVNDYLSERDADILSETMLGEKTLRTLLDIVFENTTSRKLKIAEVGDSPIALTSKLTELLQTPGMQQVSYAIAHSKPDLLKKDTLPQNCDVVSWNTNAAFTFKDVDLFVMKYLNCQMKDLKNVLENAVLTLKDNGFIAVILKTKLIPAEMFLLAVGETVVPVHSETNFEQICKESNLKIVCKKSDSLTSTSYLLRKVPELSFNDVVIPIVECRYEKWVDQLKDELVKSSTANEPRRIWLLSEESMSSGLVGLVNCLRQEPGGSSIRCIFTSKGDKVPPFSVDSKFYNDIVQKDLTMNIFRKESWGTYRHLKMTEDYSKKETSHAYLNVLTRGDLSSLVWVDAPLKFFCPSEEHSVLCQVYYAPLNFRDVMLASGKLPPDAIPGDLVLQDCILGLEFSGRLTNGKRVMGLVPAKGLATTVAADPDFVWDVPDEWTLEEASTVPVAYSTAYYALVIRGNLKEGDRVLIHSGSGGVGQAAISIALSFGCEVFTTVGSTEKKEYLKKRFTSLQDRNFCNSRDTSFEQYILNATNGEGVDVILNSLADEKLKATLNCLAQHGRFLEIGKYDLSNNSPLGMAIFLKNISFHGILLDALFESTGYSGRVKKQVVQLVKDGIADGTVKPLNSILYNHEEAEQAFRFMASGKHIGKVVLKIREEELEKQAIPTSVKLTALNRTMCNPKKSYVIIGGLGGFGLELSQWLVERGARTIILTSRSGVKTGYQQLCVQRWKQDGVNIVVSKLNVANQKETQSLLKMAAEHGVVGGIFNLALVLRDAFMENQTVKNFVEVGESKIQSTLNLDQISRKLCPELEWFVCFSSVSCGRGNAGQSNYGFANSAMERICEERCKQGLPGLAIQWGAIGDVGVIQDTVGSDVVIGGTVPQRIHSCLSVLDKFLQQSHPVVSSFVPYQPSETTSQKSSKHNVLSTVANIFGIKDMSSINPEQSLGELGMDSLMGVEVKQFLERDFDLVLTVPELRQLKIKDLKELEGGADSSETQKPTEKTTADDDFNAFLQFSWDVKKQLVPSSTIVPLNSVKSGVPLIVIHPIEGTTDMLKSLSKNLKCPVYGVQCTPEAPSDCIENLAAWYWKKIDAAKVGKTINLAGYSFGASVAFEMAVQAERNGKQLHPKVLSVTMLDGSPALVTTYTKDHKARFLENAETMGEAQALCSFALQFIDIKISELKDELVKLPSFTERVQNVALKISAAHPSLKVEELMTAFDLYYKKLVLSLQYTPQYRLNRDITLIKAADSVNLTKTFSDAYDLEKVCDGKISVHAIKGTHQTFIETREISDLLSKTFNSGD